MMGGAQRHIVKLCQAVPRDLVSLSVFLLVRDEAQDLLPEIPPDVPVFVSPFRRHHPLVLPWLGAQLRTLRTDVAHSFLWAADAYASLSSALFSHTPLICSERGDRTPTMYSRARNLFDRVVTFRVARHVCANSQFGQSLLVTNGCDPTRTSVIHNGIDLARIDAHTPADIRAIQGWPADAVVLGTVSRLVKSKGVDVLIRAVARLAHRWPVYCVLVGDGPQRAELEQLACDLGVNGRIAFLGTRLPSEPLARGFDIATLMTRTTEAFSNSILEYMALGRAVVATDVGGNRELVTPGETGLLVPPGDDAALAQALESLLAHPELAYNMGRRARARVEAEFRMEQTTEQFVELWHRHSRRPSPVASTGSREQRSRS
jgi:glycosyltransferase involved in cell wall biosynthesis